MPAESPFQIWGAAFTGIQPTGTSELLRWPFPQAAIATLAPALKAFGVDQVSVRHNPRRLSDNGASYISEDLADWLKGKGMSHVRGAPYHPQTQGKIERWHQTLENRILLENYFLPGDLETPIGAFIEHCNNHRYHESLKKPHARRCLLPAGQAILKQRDRIKQKTIEQRRLQHSKQAT